MNSGFEKLSVRRSLFGDRAFYHRVFVIILPMIVQNTLSCVLGLLDNIMVGEIGSLPMSAVAITSQLFFVFYLTLFGALAGAGIYGAQFFGSGNMEGVRNTLRVKFMVGFLLTVAAMLLFFFAGDSIIASFISADASKADWLKIFNYNDTFTMEWFDGSHWKMDWGLIIYLALVIAFTFFYAEMEIDPETLADNFQKNGSYIPGIRPGKETERYVGKVLNRVTFIGAMALGFIASLPIVLVWANVFDGDNTLALGGTGLIIIVGVALELNAQIDGLLAGKSFDEVREGM